MALEDLHNGHLTKKIIAFYTILSCIWILGSSLPWINLTIDSNYLIQLHLLKNVVFVLLNGIVLYCLFFLKHKDEPPIQPKKVNTKIDLLEKKYQELVQCIKDILLRDSITRNNIEIELKKKDQLYKILAEKLPNGSVLVFDKDLKYTLAEGNELEKIGFSKIILEGKTPREMLPEYTANLLENLYRAALEGQATTQEIIYDEQVYLTHILPIVDEQGNIDSGMVITQNITFQKQMETQLEELAFHDPITHLPNKRRLLTHLETLMQQQPQNPASFMVLVVRLERFATVKYSFGHQLAEKLLIATAQRIQGSLANHKLVARVGDNLLGIILEEIPSLQEVLPLVEQLYQQMNLPFELYGQEIFSPIQIGIAMQDSTVETDWQFERPEDWLNAADTAMNYAKMESYLGYAIFHPRMYEKAVARLHLEMELRRAVTQQQLRVFYQPIFSLTGKRLSGFEALVRWQHPTQGLIPPNEFLTLAEETELINLIDWWVMSEACQQLCRWKSCIPQTEDLTMSVNLSGKLMAELGLLEKIEDILATTGICGTSLKLEVTEKAVMEYESAETSMLNQLKNLGIQLSIDDFGTGYSSLERLHQLPLDTLKIDRSFVQRMGQANESCEIVRTIITLAHTLHLDVIAEGIETQQHLEQLRSLGCEYGQGYLFSQPLTAEAAEKLLRQ